MNPEVLTVWANVMFSVKEAVYLYRLRLNYFMEDPPPPPLAPWMVWFSIHWRELASEKNLTGLNDHSLLLPHSHTHCFPFFMVQVWTSLNGLFLLFFSLYFSQNYVLMTIPRKYWWWWCNVITLKGCDPLPMSERAVMYFANSQKL